MPDSNYRFLDRLLHRLALQFGAVGELSFQLDQKIARADLPRVAAGRHVFISGLARAGTTVLMRRFYATGVYQSLTYRDMPFVLAPNLWRRLHRISKRELEEVERAHGDSLLVDVDSPESLDEVFWRIFAGDEYLLSAYLKPHTPSEEVRNKYIRYVTAILSQSDRYLSKNNNNILRLGTIRRAFPHALILIPFREPVQHAQSLLRQHRRFSELQAKDSFTLLYMRWLAHHEFGLDHRPFKFGATASSHLPYSTESLDYWLRLWCETYSWLEEYKPSSAMFVCYEDLCASEETWTCLAKMADVSAHRQLSDPLKASYRAVHGDIDRSLEILARQIYARLVVLARAQLSKYA